MTDVELFSCMSHEEALKLAEQTPTWVLEGLIGADSTMWFGEAKTRKSYLVAGAAAALATGGEFLGRNIERPYSVAIGWTDDRGAGEYAQRIRSALPDASQLDNVKYYHMPRMTSPQHWRQFANLMLEKDHEIVILDNYMQMANGDINQTPVAQEFMDGVRLLTNAMIPVLIIHHGSDRTFQGQKSRNYMGSSYMGTAVRWKMEIRKAPHRPWLMELNASGNYDSDRKFTVRPHKTAARFKLLGEERPSDEAEDKQRDRDSETLDDRKAMAEYVKADCAGESKSATARKLAKKFGGKENTYRAYLKADGPIGEQLPEDWWQ